MAVRALVIGALLLGPSLASAEVAVRSIDLPGTAPMFGFVGAERPDGLVMARQVLPARQATTTGDLVDLGTAQAEPVAAIAQSRIVFLNHKGVTSKREACRAGEACL